MASKTSQTGGVGAAPLRERALQAPASKSASAAAEPFGPSGWRPDVGLNRIKRAVRIQPLSVAVFSSVDARVPTVGNASGRFGRGPPSFQVLVQGHRTARPP